MQTPSTIGPTRTQLVTPKQILAATDLADGDVLIPHIIAQAKASGAHVTLVHAILPSESFSVDAGPILYSEPEHLESEANSILTRMASQIESHEIACDFVSKRGFALEIIQEQITATGATRLIMATHGRGKWGQFLLGSVANQLLGAIRIPVFAVGPRSHGAADRVTPRRILHPVSMTGAYRSTMELAIDLAQKYEAELTLLHIPDRDIEPSLHPGCTLSWAENLASTLVPATGRSTCPIHIELAFGNKVDEIRKMAAHIGADWIVVGVDEGFTSWPLAESTAYRVLSVADCPVFAIPHDLQIPVRARAVEAQMSTLAIA